MTSTPETQSPLHPTAPVGAAAVVFSSSHSRLASIKSHIASPLEAKLGYERRTTSSDHFRSRNVVNVPQRYSTQQVVEGQARVLALKYKHFKQPSVALSEDSGTSERAARNHLSGANAMNLTDFFNACQRIPELKAWGARMMGVTFGVNPSVDADLQKLIHTYYQMQAEREVAE